jgi:hypothetical protein
MTKFKKSISNPMTIIAIFATLSETSAAISLPFLDNDEREIYVWFLISFPFYMLFLFFITLNFNYRSLYAPSDFEKEKNFLKVIDKVGDTPPLHPHSDAVTPSKADAFRRRFSRAQAPPSAIRLCTSRLVRHNVLLPESLADLSIVDARWMNSKVDLTSLLDSLQGPNDKSTGVIVFLACDESERLLKEYTFKSLKHARTATRATFCIVYNLDSHDVKVLGQTP